MSKTSWEQTFRDSPRFAAIESVFELIKNPKLTVNEIWLKVAQVTQTLNAEERQALPAYVRAALVDREPVTALGHPSMG